MKMSNKLEEAFNKQINHELASGYIYLSMAAYFDSENLAGMAGWMKKQAQEEQEHAMKLYSHVIDRGNKVVLDEIPKPKTSWNSPLEVFEDSLKHEQKVTGLINDLFELAMEEKDHPAHMHLHWFVEEQVEEEATVEGIIEKLKLVGESGNGLLMLDNELGKRAQ